MTRKMLVLVLLAAAVLAVLMVGLHDGNDVRTTASSAEDAARGAPDAGTPSARATAAAPATPIAASTTNAAAATPTPEPPGLVPLGMDRGEFLRRGLPGHVLALNAQEAAWLGQHGFPTPEELASLDVASSEALLARAQRGDPADLALYAKKLQRDGRCATPQGASECAEWMRRASVAGSLYAMQEYPLAAVGSDRTIGGDELARANAYAVLAEMLGQPDASRAVVPLSRRGLPTAADLQDANAAAAQLWESLNLERQRAGLPPLIPDPRPPRSPEEQDSLVFGGPDSQVLSFPRERQ